MEVLKKILSRVAMMCLLVWLVMASVFSNTNQRNFYSRQFQRWNVSWATGMSYEDLDVAMDVLLDYLEDSRDDLDVEAVKFGEKAQVFYEREILHMVDVKVLYQRCHTVMYLALAAGVACCVALWFICKNKGLFLNSLVGGYKFRLVAFVLFFCFMGGAMLINFDKFWITFHHIFFTNDLWLLDPRYSTMINMLPEGLFNALCLRILFTFGVGFAFFSTALLRTAKRTPMPLAEP